MLLFERGAKRQNENTIGHVLVVRVVHCPSDEELQKVQTFSSLGKGLGAPKCNYFIKHASELELRSTLFSVDAYFLVQCTLSQKLQVVSTSHKHGAVATGGMAAAFSTSKKVSKATKAAVISSKKAEVARGVDGFLIYDLKFVKDLSTLISFTSRPELGDLFSTGRKKCRVNVWQSAAKSAALLPHCSYR